MANKFQVKRTSTSGRTPNTTSSGNAQYIAAGEFGLNMADKILYTSDGTNLIPVGANVVDLHITNSIFFDNNKQLRFQTVNTAAYVGFRQQNDDNFVFYSTDASYNQRAIWSVFANSSTSNISFSVPAVFNTTTYLTALNANGSIGTAGQVLSSDGTKTYWVTPGLASVNTNAQWAWTNTHSFSANITVTGNAVGLASNTTAIYFAGAADANWKIGRNTGAVTKFYYSNNTLDIVAAASNLEGVVIGQPGGNTYLETGYAGTFTKNPIYVGNATVNVTINSTSFTGTSNNSSYLNGKAESALNVNNALTANSASYLGAKLEAALNVNSALTANNSDYLDGFHAAVFIQNTDSRTLSGNLVFSAANVAFTGNARFSGGIYANSSLGTLKQFLASNGTSVYWATGDLTYFPDSAFKKSVRAATTADLGGVTATTTTLTASTLVALPAQDGITLAVGDRLLVKNQTAPAQNGIYDVTNLGSAGVTAWVLTRSADADTVAEIAGGTVVIDSGTVNGGRTFNNDLKTTDTLGTTSMTWNRNVDDGGGTFVGDIVMGTGSTGIYPTSNTVGDLLGNTTARWEVYATNGFFAGAVSGITTLAAGNTTVTGFVNATTVAAGANVYMNASHIFVSTNATMNTVITANQITLNGANVMTTATTLKVYYANGTVAFP